jgi:hypothetical protein
MATMWGSTIIETTVGLDIEVFLNTTGEIFKNKFIVNGKFALVSKYTYFSKFNYQSTGL